MFDLEVVCIAPHDSNGTCRYTKRVANRTIADSTAKTLVRRVADAGYMMRSHRVWSNGESVGYAYRVLGGPIVGYANITEVVGE
jgi:hypothetical protein